MADSMTPGNRLYLYRLLSTSLGFNNQVPMAKAEEILAADDVQPQDVGFLTAQAMFESKHFAGVAKVDVFKKGRILLTITRNAELDEALQAAEDAEARQAEEAKAPKPAQKAKQSQRGKAGKNPHAGTKAVLKPGKPGGQRRKEEARAAKAAQAAREAQEAAERAEREAREAAERAQAERLAREAQEREEAEKAEREAREAAERALREAEAREAREQAKREAAQRALEQQMARVTTPISELKRPGLRISYDPYEDTDQPAPVMPAGGAMPDAPVDHIADQAVQCRTEPQGAVAAPEPRMHEDVAPARQTAAPQAAAPLRQAPSAAVMADYPRSISNDVFCPTPLLSTLSRILPLQIDLMALLDEDWKVARATGAVSGSRSRVTFPLRYLREDGARPVEVTLKRAGRPGSGSRWEMALVDGDDGKGDVHETAALEGLPLADEGAWDDLSVSSSWRPLVSGPLRELARYAVLGTWDSILGDLARMAAPERWNYPGTPVVPSAAGDTRYGVLREYLAVTFHRARSQGKLVEAADGSFSAFNTGLVTASLEDIFACFEPTGSDIPWRFAWFAQAGSGDLGRQIASKLQRVPEPATYIERLEDILPREGARLALDYRALLGDCLGRLPRGFLNNILADMEGPVANIDRMGEASLSPTERAQAKERLARFIGDVPAARRRFARALEDAAEQALAACRRSYRTAVPVFDPACDALKMLLPLRLVDDRAVDVALVVESLPSGNLQGISLVTLARAYACARIVSSEQPSWLCADRVLV